MEIEKTKWTAKPIKLVEKAIRSLAGEPVIARAGLPLL